MKTVLEALASLSLFVPFIWMDERREHRMRERRRVRARLGRLGEGTTPPP